MKKKIITIALVALLVVGTVSIALSYGRGRGRGDGRGGFPAGLGPQRAKMEKSESALTEEQLAELKSLRTDFVKETLPARNELEIKALELQQLWTADELDEEAIMAKSREVADLQNQLHEKMIRHRLDAAKVLPKEYRTRFLAKAHRGSGRGSQGRGPRGYGFGSRGRGHQGRGPGMMNMRGRGGGPGMGNMRGHRGGPGFQGHRW
jgi:Spy/CpxP family protein refolding chaperone